MFVTGWVGLDNRLTNEPITMESAKIPENPNTSTAIETVDIPAVFSNLTPYLTASRKQAKAYLDMAGSPESLAGLDVTLRFHFVRFDGDAEPQFRRLAYVLAQHLVRYCFSARSRQEHKQNIDDLDEGQLFMMARDMFRKINTSGEVGELLLFFILETILGAPQVIAKMELKTNPKDEVKGCDGIHIGWDEAKKEVLFYLGESKLYGRVSDALRDALESIASLNEAGRRDDEIRLMTSHFKHLDDSLKAEVFEVANNTAAVGSRFVHACLLGFDWDAYKDMAKDKKVFSANFATLYKTEISRLTAAVHEKLKEYKYRNLRFEFIFLPFSSVDEFRQMFYKSISGT